MLFPFSVPLIKKDFDVTYNKKLCREMKELFENFEDVMKKRMKDSKAIGLSDYKSYTKTLTKTCEMVKTF
jgi:hypothetical protein